MAVDLSQFLPLTREEANRFLSYVHFADSGCWLWTGALTTGNSKSKTDTGGYGKFFLRGHTVLVHRLMFASRFGTIQHTLDHKPTCPRNCLNPLHMEDVTSAVNVLRGNGIMAQHARKTHCTRGHPLSGDNLVLVPGGRMCRICRRLSYGWYRQRKKQTARSK